MKSQNKKVAEKIIDILQSGLTINADTQHYIDSTFSNPSAAELEALLQDESSCETDSLLALLFFPEESVQLQLEELIGDTDWQLQEEREIKDRVVARSIQTQIPFADGRGTLHMEVTPSNAAQFIERLNLSRNLDPKIRSAIDRHVHPENQNRCKVRFRNARPIISSEKVSFLQIFFEKLRIDKDEFFNYLDFILGFLGELNTGPDLFRALMVRKKLYLQSLQKAKKLDIQLTQHNVETLLLRGSRIPHVDREDARIKIQMIDRISLAVFGRTEFFDLMPAAEQSICLDGKDDIDKLMRELSSCQSKRKLESS